MKFIYLPAIQVWAYTANLQFNGKTLTFWRDNDLFQHPYFLFAAPYGMEANCKMNIPENGIVMCDSGGYEQVTKQIEYDPEKIIKYQQENSTCGIILDFPPYSFGNHAQFTGEASDIFDISLRKTKKNAQVMLDHKKENYDLYGVIQGQTLNHLKKWHTEIDSVGNFESWALSPKPSSDLFQIALHLLYAYENNFKKIHVLQVSGFSGMALLAHFSKYFKGDTLTFDSSTWIRRGSGMRQYNITPFKGGYVTLNQKSRVEQLTCLCPICSHCTLNDMKGPTGIHAMLISLHNLYHKIQESKILYELAQKDEERFNEFVRNKKFLEAKQFIDEGIEKGLKYVVGKYHQKLKYSDVVKKQSNLFNW